MNNEIPFGFNTPESPKDYRDIQFSEVAMAFQPPEKYFVDVSKIPVTMQYKRGSCVAHATAKRKEKVELDDNGVMVQLSPRFLYAMIKHDDGNSYEGTVIRNGLKMLQKYGVCTEALYPSDYPNMSHEEFMDFSKVTDAMKKEAEIYKDYTYTAVPMNKDSLKQAIMQGNGVIARVVMSKNWWTDKNGNVTWNEQALMPMRPSDEQSPATGGHAVWLYGFDGDRFWGRNSWSEGWGAKGDFYFDWNTYSKDLTEAWTSLDIDNQKIEEIRKLPLPQPITRTLFYGVWGDDVKRVQKALGVTPVSGWFGPKTRDAVKKFQRENGIDPVGQIGPITRKALNEKYFA